MRKQGATLFCRHRIHIGPTPPHPISLFARRDRQRGIRCEQSIQLHRIREDTGERCLVRPVLTTVGEEEAEIIEKLSLILCSSFKHEGVEGV